MLNKKCYYSNFIKIIPSFKKRTNYLLWMSCPRSKWLNTWYIHSYRTCLAIVQPYKANIYGKDNAAKKLCLNKFLRQKSYMISN